MRYKIANFVKFILNPFKFLNFLFLFTILSFHPWIQGIDIDSFLRQVAGQTAFLLIEWLVDQPIS